MRIKASAWWSVVCAEIVCCVFVDSMTNRDLWLRCSLDAGINSMESRHDASDFVTQQPANTSFLIWLLLQFLSNLPNRTAHGAQHRIEIIWRFMGLLSILILREILLHIYLFAGWIMALVERFWSRKSLSLDVISSSILIKKKREEKSSINFAWNSHTLNFHTENFFTAISHP